MDTQTTYQAYIESQVAEAVVAITSGSCCFVIERQRVERDCKGDDTRA